MKFKIKMFVLLVIGMITFTSCSSEMEQMQGQKNTENLRPVNPELSMEENEAIDIIIREIEGTNTTEKKAKINCMEINSIGDGYQAHACVSINGNIYEVFHHSDYYLNGVWHPSFSTASLVPSCNC